MTIHIVGLGPGSPELVTPQTLALLESGAPVILRTRRHPTVEALDAGRRFADCDDIYQGATDFEAVYGTIAARVVAAGRDGDVVYAVPGHPLVQERSVVRLLAEAEAAGIDARAYPALSFVDLAAAALRVDIGSLQVCDALALRVDAERAALIGQVFDRDTASAVKLALLDVYPADHEVVVLSALGTPGEQLRRAPLEALDRQAFGYLDCVYVPPLSAIGNVRRFDGLFAVIERLHAADGCPWDREQTHASLRPHLLEEAYETLAAIDAGDPGALAEELGDVLLQVLMHAAVAVREEEFTFGDVTEHIARKLIRRHPHVFGEGTAASAAEVYQNWEALKQSEKPRDSILEGVPRTLPALAAAQAMHGRASRVGFAWDSADGPLAKLREEIEEFSRAEPGVEREDEFGDILFVAATIGARYGVDAEQALRRANQKFRERFGELERLCRERQLDLKALDEERVLALWREAKARVAARL